MIRKITAGIALFGLSQSLWALNLTDAGGVDNLIDVEWLENSGVYTSEQPWMEAEYCGGVCTLGVQQLPNSEGATAWTLVEGQTDIFYIDFQAFGYTSDYPVVFAIKFGGNMQGCEADLDGSNCVLGTESWTDIDYALYTNTDRYGVIDLSVFNRTNGDLQIGVVSHVTVPEPSLLSLLGAGLVAVGLAGRRRRRGTSV